jgi:gliding motility-associated-like protein
MKHRKNLLAASLFFCLFGLSAQITITNADMPSLNDNILISVNTSLSGFHADSTGPHYTWDWSKLIPDSQRYVKFVSAATTPYPLPFSFNSSYGTRNYTPDQLPWSLLGTPPTNVYDFFKNSGGSYSMVGEGLTEGTTAIPGVYSAADKVYQFPETYLKKDSSNSLFAFPIPNQGYFAKKQKRVNVVDGWGTLITPYGTFNTIRVKSTITVVDSVYIDTVHFGFNLPQPTQYEFKWLAAGGKIPILEIDATGATTSNLTITRANWRDSLMVTPTVNFIEQSSCPVVNEGSLTANTSGARYPLTYLWSNGKTTPTISNLAPGTYSVTITDRYGRVIHAVDSVKTLTDSSCMILVNFSTTKTCPMTKDGSATATVTGARNPSKYLWSNGDTTLSIGNLPPGNYGFIVTDKYGRQTTATATIEGYSQEIRCLNIPTAFTPDGDGVNDVWNIRSLSEYSNSKTEIFNQWGSLIFKSTGYTNAWDGTYNGDPVPAGAYYYVIDLGNGSNKFTGTVTIIK